MPTGTLKYRRRVFTRGSAVVEMTQNSEASARIYSRYEHASFTPIHAIRDGTALASPSTCTQARWDSCQRIDACGLASDG